MGEVCQRATGRGGRVLARDLVGRSVADVGRGLILDTLDHCSGNRTQAARVLGISIRTLRNKLHEYATEHACTAQSGAGHGLAVRAVVS